VHHDFKAQMGLRSPPWIHPMTKPFVRAREVGAKRTTTRAMPGGSFATEGGRPSMTETNKPAPTVKGHTSGIPARPPGAHRIATSRADGPRPAAARGVHRGEWAVSKGRPCGVVFDA